MKTKENTNAKENINAVGSNSKSTAPNAVCWLDVILFEDNTIAVEIYYVDIVWRRFYNSFVRCKSHSEL